MYQIDVHYNVFAVMITLIPIIDSLIFMEKKTHDVRILFQNVKLYDKYHGS